MPRSIDVDRQGYVATVTINNPSKRNALDFQLLDGLSKAFRELGDARCVLIRGAGENSFCSGFDINSIPTASDGASEAGERFANNDDILAAPFAAIRTFPYPVIAYLNGHTFGAGCELAASCDMRVALPGMKIGMPPAKLGVVYSPEGLAKFVRLVGTSKARELFFSGEAISTEEAQRIGFVNHCRADAEAFVQTLAEQIAANAPLSLTGMKAIFNAIDEGSAVVHAQADEFRVLRAQAFASSDLQEGRLAFLEKRPPRFKGR